MRRQLAVAIAACLAAGAGVTVAVADSNGGGPHKAIQDHVGPNTSSPPPGQVQVKPQGPAPASNGAPIAQAHDGEIVTPDELGGIPVPFSASTLDPTTVFLGRSGADYVDLYAGADPSDESIGLLVVSVQDAGGAPPIYTSGTYQLPGSGALTLVRVAGAHVSLVDASGNSRSFDLVTGRFG